MCKVYRRSQSSTSESSAALSSDRASVAISPLVDAQRGVIAARFSLPQATQPFLREDMTLSVEVETARRDAALVVPVDALRGDRAASRSVVLVERDGHVEERPVQVCPSTLEAAEVIAGLRGCCPVRRGAPRRRPGG